MPMGTWKAVSWDSKVEYFAAYTESEAYEKAVAWAGNAGLQGFWKIND